MSCPPPPLPADEIRRPGPLLTIEEGVKAGQLPRWGDVGVGRTRVRTANVIPRRPVSVGHRANIHRDRQRGIAPVGRTVRSAGGCVWDSASSGRGAEGAVARYAVAGIHDVAVGPTPETLSTLCEVLRLAERPREASVAEGVFLPAKPFVPHGDACADIPPCQRPRGRSPDAPWSSGSAMSLSTLSGLTPEVLSTPCEVLRLAERPRGASVAEGAFPPAKPFIPPGDARADVPPPDKAKG